MTEPVYHDTIDATWRDVPLPQVVLPESTPQRLEMLESAITRYYEAQQRQVRGDVEYAAAKQTIDPARHMRACALVNEGRAAVYLAATELITLGKALLHERSDTLREKVREESVEAMKQTSKFCKGFAPGVVRVGMVFENDKYPPFLVTRIEGDKAFAKYPGRNSDDLHFTVSVLANYPLAEDFVLLEK